MLCVSYFMFIAVDEKSFNFKPHRQTNGMERKGNACNAYEMIWPVCYNIAVIDLLLYGKISKISNKYVYNKSRNTTHTNTHSLLFLEWGPMGISQHQKNYIFVQVFSVIHVCTLAEQTTERKKGFSAPIQASVCVSVFANCKLNGKEIKSNI